MKLKVLCVGFCPPVGVMTEHFLQIVSGLSEVVDVSILCPKNLPLEQLHFSECYLIDYSKQTPLSFLSGSSMQLLLQAQKAKYDVVFFFTQHILNIPVSLVLRKFNQVMWWHEPIKAGRTTFLKQLLYAASDGVLTRTSKIIIIACESMRPMIPSILLPKIRVVSLPFLNSFQLLASESHEKENKADLVYFGNIEEYKGLDTLADALEHLYDQNISFSLMVIGKGDIERYCPRLLNLANRYPSRINIRNRYESSQAIVDAIHHCRAVVLPYRTGSGTGTVQIAYHMHKPVIATRVGCLQDYVKDNETGIVVPPNDPQALAQAIQRLCADPILAAQFGNQGYQYLMSDFLQPEITRQILAVFMANRDDN